VGLNGSRVHDVGENTKQKPEHLAADWKHATTQDLNPLIQYLEGTFNTSSKTLSTAILQLAFPDPSLTL
jgi:hypothetical protein